MRPLVDFQYIFHAGYECSVAVWRDDPLLLKVRLENVFFSVRPIVLSLARSTMFSSTTADSSSFSVHRTRPLGGSEQANAISLASLAPSKMGFLAEAGECLRVRTDSRPSSTSCCRVRATVVTLVSKAAAIGCHSIPRLARKHRPSAGCVPLPIGERGVCPSGSTC